MTHNIQHVLLVFINIQQHHHHHHHHHHHGRFMMALLFYICFTNARLYVGRITGWHNTGMGKLKDLGYRRVWVILFIIVNIFPLLYCLLFVWVFGLDHVHFCRSGSDLLIRPWRVHLQMRNVTEELGFFAMFDYVPKWFHHVYGEKPIG